MAAIDRAKEWARAVKRDMVAVWLAARDARTPVFAKLVAAAVAAYALSPVDFIPDFIPVLGYLDDLLIVPLGIMLAVRLVPSDLMREFRQAAAERAGKPVSRGGLLIITGLWLAGAILVALLIARQIW